MTELEVVPEGERELAELVITPGLLLALNGSEGARMMPPPIRFRWNPALVAKMAKVSESHTPWQEQPRWLRIMPQLTQWRLL